MRIKWKLTVASFKMYFRQREAVLWTLLFPLLMILMFSFVNFDRFGSIDLGIVNEAGDRAIDLIEALREVKTLNVVEGPRMQELDQLHKGERDIVLVIGQSLSIGVHDSLTAYIGSEKPQAAQLGTLVLQKVIDELTFDQLPTANRVYLKVETMKSRNLTYIDFLLPGVLSMSIMQMGIFGVAFGFVSLKKRGILRRLWVTPINPNDFILAQVVTRMVVVMMQVSVMIGSGVLFFDLHFVGSFVELFIVGMLGAVVFLAIGFALAGISKSEDQVAPLANIISLPMMLLSGVFFSRSNLPGFVNVITDYFPLTYLADGMRSIAIDGASLGQIGPQLLGLCVWSIISCTVAIKMFRWE
jgi:ABC-2 type transport system permease protein